MRRNKVFAAGAAALALGLSLTACGTTEDKKGSGGSGGDAACDLKLAFFGPETGDAAGLGKPIIQGAQLAIDQYNEEHSDCEVEFVKRDSQGSPDAAPALATDVAGDDSIIGVVGPAFSGESAAAGPIFAEVGVPTVSPSATNPALSENGWDTFHRALGNDATQGPAAARYIKDTLKASTVYVIDDASEYGAGLAGIVEEDLGDAVVGTDTIQQKQTDFSATVTKVTDAKPDAVFFGGYYAEATILIGQLRNGGWDGTFVVADGVKDPAFLDAGKAAEGTIITCPCIPDTDPAVAEFAKSYEAAFGEAPGTYAAEAYDAASIFLDGIGDGIDNREDMLKFVNDYDEKGITKQLKFDDKGEPADVHVYAYTVKDGAIVPEGEIK
ncbi:branched-chain amino acid ABC transporter substrate-binding protein [Nocardioides humi]|uniref:Branched-chain amino acid ABC transporter substrate-binding protein n=1 Tax=Nocardioides humi TaxID=449461 RepID=A0ABN2ANZ6_9ACTN|nr:branched-chain amino acid ABC transporter substrate-binding protein [Nocardioides humi]